jgi:hypothetical protein
LKELIAVKTFLIQTVDNVIVHDFSFQLIESIKFHNWYYNKPIYNYVLSNTTERPIMNNIQYYPLEEIIPIGTVEFVLEYLEKYYGISNVKPLNIPIELRKFAYLKRFLKESISDKPIFNAGETPVFVKDNTKIKGWTNIVEPNRSYPAGEYLVSEFIDIESEWRAFVNNRELVGLQNYSGDFTMFPDVELIELMIDDYKMCPLSYTLDVGINKKLGTFIIECHDFFSCGLYGFADHKLLPKMFINTWNKLIK